MRLAYICADRGITVPSDSPGSVHFEALLRAFQRAGHRVTAILALGEGPVPGADHVVRLRPSEAADRLRVALTDGGRATLARELWAALLNPALEAALEAEHRRERLDAVLERLSLWSFAAPFFCRRNGIPHALEVNSHLPSEQVRHREHELVDAFTAVHDLTVAQAGVLFCVSRPLADRYRELTSAPVEVLPNGADVDRFRPGLRCPVRPAWAEGFVAGFIGGLRPWHDLDTVAAAAGLLPEGARVVMYGGGAGRERLLQTAAARSGRLVLPGRVAVADAPGLMGWFSAGLVSHEPGESYFSPLKLRDALASGLPVLVPAGTEGDELVPEGLKAAYRAGDPESLAAAVLRLRERGSGPDVASGARALAVSWTWDHVAARIVAELGSAARPGA
ncbi:MAG TPA: glycosyltransferase [Candidatus Acidoferrales bacterium]|nr:glycosyltransferase [Candidatus Acidoferrales bacterium]